MQQQPHRSNVPAALMSSHILWSWPKNRGTLGESEVSSCLWMAIETLTGRRDGTENMCLTFSTTVMLCLFVPSRRKNDNANAELPAWRSPFSSHCEDKKFHPQLTWSPIRSIHALHKTSKLGFEKSFVPFLNAVVHRFRKTFVCAKRLVDGLTDMFHCDRIN